MKLFYKKFASGHTGKKELQPIEVLSLSDLDGHSHVFQTFFFMAWFMLTRPVVYISGSVNTNEIVGGS